MRAYTQWLVRTCHRRKAHAMGGMAAYIPIKSNPVANEAAVYKVEQDKLREVKDGHDGTWVAHPGLVPVARAVFDTHMPTPHQIHVARNDVHITESDLLSIPQGPKTWEGFTYNITIALQYMAAWLQGQGCVPLNNLMEDAATAEISRTQIWQWMRHRTVLDTGETITPELVRTTLKTLTQSLTEEKNNLYTPTSLRQASELLMPMLTGPYLHPFLTSEAYRCI